MSRTMPSEHELIEWLQDMRRFASKDADRATVLLDILEGKQDAQFFLDAILLGAPRATGAPDVDAAVHANLQYDAICTLCERAGILDRKDAAPDIASLLAMFVPPADH